MRRVLITGVTGFAGGHLAEALLTQSDVELHGAARTAAWPRRRMALAECVNLHAVDLASDDSRLVEYLRSIKPDQIYHLAGYAAVGQSFREPDAAWRGNLTATRRLYQAIAEWGGKPRIVFVSSGLIYGDGHGRPLTENDVLQPVSPYAVSKASADLLSFQFGLEQRLDIIRVRAFNHIGPGQAADFAIASFSRQLAEIAAGRRDPILETGNLSSAPTLPMSATLSKRIDCSWNAARQGRPITSRLGGPIR